MSTGRSRGHDAQQVPQVGEQPGNAVERVDGAVEVAIHELGHRLGVQDVRHATGVAAPREQPKCLGESLLGAGRLFEVHVDQRRHVQCPRPRGGVLTSFGKREFGEVLRAEQVLGAECEYGQPGEQPRAGTAGVRGRQRRTEVLPRAEEIAAAGAGLSAHLEERGALLPDRLQREALVGEAFGLAVREIIQPALRRGDVGGRGGGQVARAGEVPSELVGRGRVGRERAGEQLVQPGPLHCVQPVAHRLADEVMRHHEPAGVVPDQLGD